MRKLISWPPCASIEAKLFLLRGQMMQEKETKSRDYFSFFLSVYFFVLSCLTPLVVLPSSGKPLAIHLILSLIFCVCGVIFFLRGLRVVVYVWGQAQR